MYKLAVDVWANQVGFTEFKFLRPVVAFTLVPAVESVGNKLAEYDEAGASVKPSKLVRFCGTCVEDCIEYAVEMVAAAKGTMVVEEFVAAEEVDIAVGGFVEGAAQLGSTAKNGRT